MNTTLKIIVIFFVCSTTFSATAQKDRLYLEMNKKYSNGRIYFKRTLTPVYASELTLVNDSTLNFVDKQSGKVNSLNLNTSTLNYLKIKTGTKAGQFALYGGLLMGLSGLVGVLSAEQESLELYGETSEINWVPFVAGFTAGGALVGALIGSFSPKYKNFYIKNNATSYNFEISPQYLKGGGIGLAVNVKF